MLKGPRVPGSVVVVVVLLGDSAQLAPAWERLQGEQLRRSFPFLNSQILQIRPKASGHVMSQFLRPWPRGTLTRQSSHPQERLSSEALLGACPIRPGLSPRKMEADGVYERTRIRACKAAPHPAPPIAPSPGPRCPSPHSFNLSPATPWTPPHPVHPGNYLHASLSVSMALGQGRRQTRPSVNVPRPGQTRSPLDG